MKRRMILSSTILIGYLVSGCSVLVPNVEVCRDKSVLGAHCAFTNAGDSRDIPLEQWQDYRIGMFCMKEESFAANQKFIEQACELMKNCKIEQVKIKHAELLKLLKGE